MSKNRKKIEESVGVAVLGASGSVGRQTLDVIEAMPDRFDLVAVSVGSDAEALQEICAKYDPTYAAIADTENLNAVTWPDSKRPRLVTGEEANEALCALDEVDAVVIAIPGMQAIHSLLAAAENKKRIAIANKECLVCGGDFVRERLFELDAKVYPVDSEQSAIFQCLQGLRNMDEVENLILTASGGPFRDRDRTSLASVTPEQALAHPNWAMGKKISIDSATMVNKGLEVIEAHYLFQVPGDRIQVVIHPQSIVHSLVETVDGSLLAQMGYPDMRLPIQYALTYPDRISGPAKKWDIMHGQKLDFYEADHKRFPALAMAYNALKTGGTATAIYNAADEVAVGAFLRGEIGFLEIEDCIADTLSHVPAESFSQLEIMLEADQRARRFAGEFCRRQRA